MNGIKSSIQKMLAGLGIVATIIAVYETVVKDRIAPYHKVSAEICNPVDPIAHDSLTKLARLLQTNDANVIYVTIDVITGCDKGDPAAARFSSPDSEISHRIDVGQKGFLTLELTASEQPNDFVYLTIKKNILQTTALSRVIDTWGGNLGVRVVGLFVPRGEYVEDAYYSQMIGVGYSKELDDIHKCTHSIAHADGFLSQIYNYVAVCILGTSPSLRLDS